MAIVTTVDILRHGEARGGSRYRGVTDDALTERGWRQMYRQCGELHWDVVASSSPAPLPLVRRRLVRTAAGRVARRSGLGRIRFRRLGGSDRRSHRKRVARRVGGVLPRSGTLPAAQCRKFRRVQPPRACRLGKFAGRLRRQKVLVVSHAGVVRSLFGHCLQLPLEKTFHIEIPQAGLTRFTAFDSEDGRYLQFNFHRPG